MCGPLIRLWRAFGLARATEASDVIKGKDKSGLRRRKYLPAERTRVRTPKRTHVRAGGWEVGANHRWQRSGKREAGPRGGEGRARSGCPGSRRVTGPTLGGRARREEGRKGQKVRHVRAVAPDGAAADGGFSRAREVGGRANLWLDLRLLHLSRS